MSNLAGGCADNFFAPKWWRPGDVNAVRSSFPATLFTAVENGGGPSNSSHLGLEPSPIAQDDAADLKPQRAARTRPQRVLADAATSDTTGSDDRSSSTDSYSDGDSEPGAGRIRGRSVSGKGRAASRARSSGAAGAGGNHGEHNYSELEAAWNTGEEVRLTGNPGRVLPGSDMTEREFSNLPLDERRRMQRLMRNRLSAAMHRQRQRAHIECLEQQVMELSAVVTVLVRRAREAVASCTCTAAAACIPPPLLAVSGPSTPGVLGYSLPGGGNSTGHAATLGLPHAVVEALHALSGTSGGATGSIPPAVPVVGGSGGAASVGGAAARSPSECHEAMCTAWLHGNGVGCGRTAGLSLDGAAMEAIASGQLQRLVAADAANGGSFHHAMHPSRGAAGGRGRSAAAAAASEDGEGAMHSEAGGAGATAALAVSQVRKSGRSRGRPSTGSTVPGSSAAPAPSTLLREFGTAYAGIPLGLGAAGPSSSLFPPPSLPLGAPAPVEAPQALRRATPPLAPAAAAAPAYGGVDVDVDMVLPPQGFAAAEPTGRVGLGKRPREEPAHAAALSVGALPVVPLVPLLMTQPSFEEAQDHGMHMPSSASSSHAAAPLLPGGMPLSALAALPQAFAADVAAALSAVTAALASASGGDLGAAEAAAGEASLLSRLTEAMVARGIPPAAIAAAAAAGGAALSAVSGGARIADASTSDMRLSTNSAVAITMDAPGPGGSGGRDRRGSSSASSAIIPYRQRRSSSFDLAPPSPAGAAAHAGTPALILPGALGRIPTLDVHAPHHLFTGSQPSSLALATPAPQLVLPPLHSLPSFLPDTSAAAPAPGAAHFLAMQDSPSYSSSGSDAAAPSPAPFDLEAPAHPLGGHSAAGMALASSPMGSSSEAPGFRVPALPALTSFGSFLPSLPAHAHTYRAPAAAAGSALGSPPSSAVPARMSTGTPLAAAASALSPRPSRASVGGTGARPSLAALVGVGLVATVMVVGGGGAAPGSGGQLTHTISKWLAKQDPTSGLVPLTQPLGRRLLQVEEEEEEAVEPSPADLDTGLVVPPPAAHALPQESGLLPPSYAGAYRVSASDELAGAPGGPGGQSSTNSDLTLQDVLQRANAVRAQLLSLANSLPASSHSQPSIADWRLTASELDDLSARLRAAMLTGSLRAPVEATGGNATGQAHGEPVLVSLPFTTTGASLRGTSGLGSAASAANMSNVGPVKTSDSSEPQPLNFPRPARGRQPAAEANATLTHEREPVTVDVTSIVRAGHRFGRTLAQLLQGMGSDEDSGASSQQRTAGTFAPFPSPASDLPFGIDGATDGALTAALQAYADSARAAFLSTSSGSARSFAGGKLHRDNHHRRWPARNSYWQDPSVDEASGKSLALALPQGPETAPGSYASEGENAANDASRHGRSHSRSPANYLLCFDGVASVTTHEEDAGNSASEGADGSAGGNEGASASATHAYTVRARRLLPAGSLQQASALAAPPMPHGGLPLFSLPSSASVADVDGTGDVAADAPPAGCPTRTCQPGASHEPAHSGSKPYMVILMPASANGSASEAPRASQTDEGARDDFGSYGSERDSTSEERSREAPPTASASAGSFNRGSSTQWSSSSASGGQRRDGGNERQRGSASASSSASAGGAGEWLEVGCEVISMRRLVTA